MNSVLLTVWTASVSPHPSGDSSVGLKTHILPDFQPICTGSTTVLRFIELKRSSRALTRSQAANAAYERLMRDKAQ
jgi:hypothetical protein